jgi:hypothetical protein
MKPMVESWHSTGAVFVSADRFFLPLPDLRIKKTPGQMAGGVFQQNVMVSATGLEPVTQ